MFFKSKKQKILVIDDDVSLLKQLRFRLEKHEMVEVIEAETGKNGLRKASQSSPDLIILDWMLPDIQGIEVLGRLKKDKFTLDIPVLMLTGRNKVGNIEDAFNLGAKAYLTKPFTLEALGEKVTELLSQKS